MSIKNEIKTQQKKIVANFSIYFLILTNIFSGLLAYYYFSKLEILNKSIFSSEIRGQVWQIVNNNFLNPIPEAKKLSQGELKGLVQALGDTNSAYLIAEQNDRFQDELNQKYVGVGIEFVQQSETENKYIVNSVVDNSPAQNVGIEKGDQLIAIDENSLEGLTFIDVINKIRGPENSSVKLTFIKPKQEPRIEQTFNLTRTSIQDRQVKLTIENEFGIIEIKSFGDQIDKQMLEIANQIKANPSITKLILDLRGDGGGLLDQGTDLASYFLPEKSVVFIEKDKNNNQVKNFSKLKNESLVNYPLVVLVDNGSASASEIVASSLRDNRDVKLVGTKTFGKGTIQKLFSLENGDTLKLTVAQWLTPKGVQIDKIGLEPDIIVGIEQDAIEVAKNIFT